MAYVIDGHNLIGILPDIELHQPDDESRLLDRLRSFRAYRGGPAMIVFFDAGPLGGSAAPRGPVAAAGLAVHFSQPGQTADDAIVAFLRAAPQPGQYAVVTNDQGLAARVRGLGASVLAASEFARQMQRRPARPTQNGSTLSAPGPSPHDPAFADLYQDFLAAEKAAQQAPPRKTDAATWIERLYTGDPQLAERAAQWLGQNGGDGAAAALCDALTHSQAAVRAAAALALGALRHAGAVHDLGSRLAADRHSMVREAAAQALGRIGDRAALPALEAVAGSDPKSKVRKAAEAALAQIRARRV